MRRSLTLSLMTLPIAGAAAAESAGPTGADGWHVLGGIETVEHETETSWSVTKRYPPEIADGADAFELSGYLVPVGFGAETRDFMMVTDLASCPFCGSGDHGRSIEVRLADPIPATEDARRATIRGALHLVRDADTLQAVVMTDAVLLDG